MVWESTFACFAAGSLNDISCIMGQGLGSLFGGAIVATFIVFIMSFILLYRLKMQPEFIAVALVTEASIFILVFAPSWVKLALIVLLVILAGFGYNKFFRRVG
jgi:hypothetical protein